VDPVSTILQQFQQNTLPELAAVVLAITYLLLAVRQRIECWYAAFISTAIFLWVFWQVDLYMESGLQIYYLAMAVYGWWQWRTPAEGSGRSLPVSTWNWTAHLAALSFIAIATLASGTALADTDQRLPFLDSFTTWGAIVTTFMVARKILENWIYWLVIDAASIYLYLDRELYFTALLFAAYIVIIFFGFTAWLKDYTQSQQRVA
jgi:nicotinamide mononucleotide transporter